MTDTLIGKWIINSPPDKSYILPGQIQDVSNGYAMVRHEDPRSMTTETKFFLISLVRLARWDETTIFESRAAFISKFADTLRHTSNVIALAPKEMTP